MKGAPFPAFFGTIQKSPGSIFMTNPPVNRNSFPSWAAGWPLVQTGPDEARIRSMATEIAGGLGVGVALLGQAEAYQVRMARTWRGIGLGNFAGIIRKWFSSTYLVLSIALFLGTLSLVLVYLVTSYISL